MQYCWLMLAYILWEFNHQISINFNHQTRGIFPSGSQTCLPGKSRINGHVFKWDIIELNGWFSIAMFERQMLICVVFCIYSQSTIGESGNIWGIYSEYVSFCPQRNLNPAVFPRPSAVLGMMMPAEWQRVDGPSSDDSIKHGWLGTPTWKIGIVGTFHRSQCVFCHVWHRRVKRSWQEWWCNGDFSWDRMGYWWWNPSK